MLYRMLLEETGEHIETVPLNAPPTPYEPPIELKVDGELQLFRIVGYSVRGSFDERGRLVFDAKVKPIPSQ